MGAFSGVSAEGHLDNERANLARAEVSQRNLEAVAKHLASGQAPAEERLRRLTADDLRSFPLPDLAQILSGPNGCRSHAAMSVGKARDTPIIQIGSDDSESIIDTAIDIGREQIAKAQHRVDLAARIACPTPADLSDFFVMVARRVCELLSFAASPGATSADWDGSKLVPERIRGGYFRVRHFIPGYNPGRVYQPKEELGCLASVFGSLVLQVERVLPEIPPAWPDLCAAVWQLPRASDIVHADHETIRALEHGLAPLGDREEFATFAPDSAAMWREAVRLAPLLKGLTASVLPMIRSLGNLRLEPEPPPVIKPEVPMTESSKVLLGLLHCLRDNLLEFTRVGTQKLAPLLESQARLKAWWTANHGNVEATVRIRSCIDRLQSAEVMSRSGGMSTIEAISDIMEAIQFANEVSEGGTTLAAVGIGEPIAKQAEVDPTPAAPVIAGPGKLSISRKDWIHPDGRQVRLPYGGEPAEQFEALASAPINTAIQIDPLAYRINTLVERVNKNCEAMGVDWRARKDGESIRKATVQEWKDSRPPPRGSKPAKGRRKA